MSIGTIPTRRTPLRPVRDSQAVRNGLAVAAAGAFVFELDAATDELHLSADLYKLLGLDPQSNGPTRWLSFLSRLTLSSRNQLLADRKRAERGDVSITCRLEARAADETPRRFELRSRMVEQSGRRMLSGLLLLLPEQTEQTADRALVGEVGSGLHPISPGKQLAFQARVLESLQVSVVAADYQGRVAYWGPGAEELYGYSKHEAIGQRFSLMIGMETAESPDWFGQLQKQGRWKGETPIAKRDGTVIWAESEIGTVDDELERPLGWVCTTRDISEQKATDQSLQQSREQHALTLSVLRGGQWEWRLTTNQAKYSSGYRGMLGWDQQTPEGKISDWRAAIHPKDRAEVEAALNRYFSGEREIYECEYRIRSNHGHWVSVLDRGRLVDGENNGQAERMIGVTVDITENQKRANELLLMKQAVAGSVTAIAVCDETGLVSFANEAFKQLWKLRLPNGECEPADLKLMFAEFDTLLGEVKAHGCWSGEGLGRCADGSTRTIEISAGRVENSDGSFQVVATCTDITQRKNEELALRQSRKQFERMVDSLPQMVWMSGANRKCIYVNRQWLEFTGRTIEEETGHGWTACVHPDDRRSRLEIYHQAFSSRTPYVAKYRILRHDSEYRWVQDRGMPWVDECGEFAGYIGSCVDITDQKQASDQLDKKRDQLAQANRVSTIGEMATGLAHELNQPLAAMKAYANGCCNILEQHDGELAESIRKPLHHISVQAARAADIVRSLRALVRRRSPRHEAHDIVELANGIIPLFHMETAKSLQQVELSCNHADNMPRVLCDPVLIQQVLLNLLRNSVDAMSQNENATKRRIKIKTRHNGDDKITIAVSDSGPGMSDIVRERACNPFFTTKSEGLGMGLAICQSIIEEHGGSLQVGTSRLGGAKVFFSLPIIESQSHDRQSLSG